MECSSLTTCLRTESCCKLFFPVRATKSALRGTVLRPWCNEERRERRSFPLIEGDFRGLALAPAVGFEPTTNRLTADRSTTELRWNFGRERAYILPLSSEAASILSEPQK